MAGKRVVIWGAGSKGVSFLTTLGLSDEIACAVDVNPHLSGMFIPGSGHEIVEPARLSNYEPDIVIVMNPIYRHEIEAQLAGLGMQPRVLGVSDHAGRLGGRPS